MKRTLWRLYYCAIPAIAFGLLGAVLDWRVGVGIGLVVLGMGFQVTEARAERDER